MGLETTSRFVQQRLHTAISVAIACSPLPGLEDTRKRCNGPHFLTTVYGRFQPSDIFCCMHLTTPCMWPFRRQLHFCLLCLSASQSPAWSISGTRIDYEYWTSGCSRMPKWILRGPSVGQNTPNWQACSVGILYHDKQKSSMAARVHGLGSRRETHSHSNPHVHGHVDFG